MRNAPYWRKGSITMEGFCGWQVSVYMELQNMTLFGNTVFVDSTQGTIKMRLYCYWVLTEGELLEETGNDTHGMQLLSTGKCRDSRCARRWEVFPPEPLAGMHPCGYLNFMSLGF